MIRLIIITLLLSACTIQRKSAHRQSIQRFSTQEWWQKMQVQGSLQKDSNQYQLLILPKDSFSFSIMDGFKGKADWLYWEGKIHQNNFQWDSQSYHWQDQSQWEKQQKKVHEQFKNKTANWIIFLIVFLILLALFFLRKWLLNTI